MDFKFIKIKDNANIEKEDYELVERLNRHYLEYYHKYEDEIKKLLTESQYKDEKDYVIGIVDKLIEDVKKELPNLKNDISTNVQNKIFEIFAEHFSKLYVFMQGSTDGVEVDIEEYIKGNMIVFTRITINSIGKYIFSLTSNTPNAPKTPKKTPKTSKTPKTPKTPNASKTPNAPSRAKRTQNRIQGSTTKRQRKGGMPPNDKFDMIERVSISEWKIPKQSKDTKPSSKYTNKNNNNGSDKSKIKDDDHWKIDPDLLNRYYNLSINDLSLDVTKKDIEQKEIFGFQFGSSKENSLIPVLRVLYGYNVNYNQTHDYRDKYWFVLRMIANFIVNKNILYYDIETVVDDDDQEDIDVLICADAERAESRFEDVLAPISCKTEKRRTRDTHKNAIQDKKGYIERINADYNRFMKIGKLENLIYYEDNPNLNKRITGEPTMCSFNLNQNQTLSEEMLFGDSYTDDIMCLQEVNINKTMTNRLLIMHTAYVPLFLSDNIYPNLKSVLLAKFKKNNPNIIFKDVESLERFEIIAYYDATKMFIFIKNRVASYEDDEKINKHNVIRINKREYIEYILKSNQTNVYVGMTSSSTNNNSAHVVIAVKVSDTMIAMNVHLDTDHKIMYPELEYIFADIINVESFFDCDRIFIQGDFNMKGIEIIMTLEKNVENYYAMVSDNRKHLNEYYLHILFNNFITKAETGGKHIASLDNAILLTRYIEDFEDYNPNLEIWNNRGTTTTQGNVINLSDHSLIRWSANMPLAKIERRKYVIPNFGEYKADSIVDNLKKNKDARIKRMIERLNESDKKNIRPLYEKHKNIPELEHVVRKIVRTNNQKKKQESNKSNDKMIR